MAPSAGGSPIPPSGSDKKGLNAGGAQRGGGRGMHRMSSRKGSRQLRRLEKEKYLFWMILICSSLARIQELEGIKRKARGKQQSMGKGM